MSPNIISLKKDILVTINEDLMNVFDEESITILIEQEVDKININIDDVLVVPEYYSNALQQLSSVKCIKVMLVQQKDYIFENLPIGSRWSDYGFDRVITTTEASKKYILDIEDTFKVYIEKYHTHLYFVYKYRENETKPFKIDIYDSYNRDASFWLDKDIKDNIPSRIITTVCAAQAIQPNAWALILSTL